MNRFILAAAFAAGCSLASSAPALGVARNYDCSKPGNATKAQCKGKAMAAAKPTPAPKAMPAAKPAPKVAATTTTKTTSRNYDCSKAGNATKAQCKGSTTVAATTTKSAPAPAKPTMMQRMKTAMSGGKPAPTPAAAASATPAHKAPAAASSEDKNPAGAIAQCKDGTYSHSKVRSGTCSRHGGVAKWS